MFQSFPNTARDLFLAAILTCPLLSVSAQELVPAGEAHVSYGYAGTRVPFWTGGYLVPIENNGMIVPVIHSIDDAGVEAAPIMLSIPGASSMTIDGAARRPDGTWAVIGYAQDGDGKGSGFITWISPDRKNVTTIRSYPYNPYEVTITPDGTAWTQGIEVVSGNDWVGSHHGVIRRFDSSGKLMGEYIPRSSIREEINTLAMENAKLVSNKDRVGWYANRAHEYFELTYEGDKVSGPVIYPGIAPHGDDDVLVDGMAMMDNGDAYVSVYNYKPTTDRGIVYRLDRVKRSWTPVAMPAKSDGTPILEYPNILGGDGERLALFGGDSVIFVKPGD